MEMEKGLYFWCNKKFFSCHKCYRELHIIYTLASYDLLSNNKLSDLDITIIIEEEAFYMLEAPQLFFDRSTTQDMKFYDTS